MDQSDLKKKLFLVDIQSQSQSQFQTNRKTKV